MCIFKPVVFPGTIPSTPPSDIPGGAAGGSGQQPSTPEQQEVFGLQIAEGSATDELNNLLAAAAQRLQQQSGNPADDDLFPTGHRSEDDFEPFPEDADLTQDNTSQDSTDSSVADLEGAAGLNQGDPAKPVDILPVIQEEPGLPTLPAEDSDTSSSDSDSESDSESKDIDSDDDDMAKNKGVLQPFSGLPIGESFVNDQGATVQEKWSVRPWLQDCDIRANEAGWNDAQKLSSAIASLVAHTPAHGWRDEMFNDKTRIATWELFSKELRNHFLDKPDPCQLVELFRKMKQRPKERMRDYIIRQKAIFDELGHELDIGLFAQGGACEKDSDADQKAIKRGLAFARDFHMRINFMSGVNDRARLRIIENNDQTLAKMKETALDSERINRSGKGAPDLPAHVVAAAAPQAAPTASAADPAFIQAAIRDAIAAHLGQAPTAAVSAPAAPTASASAPSRKLKDRDISKVFCHFCGVCRHYSKDCTTRKHERDEGKFRATIHCPVVTAEQWGRFTKDEKQRGRYMVPGAPSPPASLNLTRMFSGAQPTAAFTAAPLPQAAHQPISEEQAFASYYAKN